MIPLFVGCSNAEKPFALPEKAPGDWHLKEKKQEGAKTLAVYEGHGTVHVEVEDTKVPAVAFEKAQRTRPQPDTVFFDKGRYFVTIRWDQADRDALKQLVRTLQKQE